MIDIAAGAVFKVPYPFVESVYSHADEGGVHESISWRPGLNFRTAPNGYGDEVEAYAQAMGGMILTVLSTHSPGGRYPERTFYTRKWEAPDRRLFGKSRCLITTTQNFRALLRGYRHDFVIAAEEVSEPVRKLRDRHAGAKKAAPARQAMLEPDDLPF